MSMTGKMLIPLWGMADSTISQPQTAETLPQNRAMGETARCLIRRQTRPGLLKPLLELRKSGIAFLFHTLSVAQAFHAWEPKLFLIVFFAFSPPSGGENAKTKERARPRRKTPGLQKTINAWGVKNGDKPMEQK
jgi:hypothetical protein